MSRDSNKTEKSAEEIAASLGPIKASAANQSEQQEQKQDDPDPQRLSIREQVEADAHDAIARALAAEAVPVFNTHSMNLSRQFEAMGETLLAQATDVRRKIRELEAEYTDLMLGFSMLTKGEQARG
jgi:S-methylmethionine-dependent homocysteine/selenocysteine methylase